MKKFTYLTLTALSILAITSCKKAVIDMSAQNNNNSANNVGNNSGGSGSSSFNWTGTAPFSAKVDGTPFVIDPESFEPYRNNLGQIFVGYWDINTTNHLSLWFPSSATAGNVYSCTVQYQLPNSSIHGSGKVKIVTNNSTEVEGYFYGNPSSSDTSFVITEGYFKMNKE